MRIAKEGYRVIAVPAVLAVLAGAMGWISALVVLALVALAEAAFFRDPDRVPPPGEDLILAPADGKIVAIRKGAAGARLRAFLLSPHRLPRRAAGGGRGEGGPVPEEHVH